MKVIIFKGWEFNNLQKKVKELLLLIFTFYHFFMEISLEQIKNIARFARINFSENEFFFMKDQLSSIITWVQQLNEVDTDLIDFYEVISVGLTVEREDLAEKNNSVDDILKNAPIVSQNYYVVPQMIK